MAQIDLADILLMVKKAGNNSGHAVRPNWKWRWVVWGVQFVAACVILVIMFRWFERTQVYHPERQLYADGSMTGLPWEDVRLMTKDSLWLNGWFFPAASESEFKNVALLLCHGNAGNISHRIGFYQVLSALGANIFAFDYRGYGLSEGSPSEEGTYTDGEAAYEWLRGRGFEATRIVPFGSSLGGAVAAELASRHPVGGLILQSTFTSIPDVGAELFPFLPVRWLCQIRYDTASKLREIHVPLLILHSRDDSMIRFQHGEKLYAAANEPKKLVELFGDHNDTVTDDLYEKAIKEFLRQLK